MKENIMSSDEIIEGLGMMVYAPILNAYSWAYDNIEKVHKHNNSILTWKYTGPLYHVILSWQLDLGWSVFEQIYQAKKSKTIEEFMKAFEIESMKKLESYCQTSYKNLIYTLKKKNRFEVIKKDLTFDVIFNDALVRHGKSFLESKIKDKKPGVESE